jgi:uncharacterized membrane protein
MSYASRLAIEAAVVAAVTALALAFAVAVTGPVGSVRKALLVGLVMGAAIHVAFELLGGNLWYCSSGAACSRR